jgi:hypothetical protein
MCRLEIHAEPQQGTHIQPYSCSNNRFSNFFITYSKANRISYIKPNHLVAYPKANNRYPELKPN